MTDSSEILVKMGSFDSSIKSIDSNVKRLLDAQEINTKEIILMGSQIKSLHSRQDKADEQINNLFKSVSRHTDLHEQAKGAKKSLLALWGIVGGFIYTTFAIIIKYVFF